MSDFEIDWIKEYLGIIPRAILDVGSYNANDSRIFKKAYPSCRVIAFEASSINYERMVRFVKEDIEMHHLAVCDKAGVIIFNDTTGDLNGSGSIHTPNENLMVLREHIEIIPETVNCTRLDTFCNKNQIGEIDVIHMDLQSAEYEALIGLGKLRPKMIFLEAGGGTFKCYDGATTPEPLLEEMGYKMLKNLRGDELWILKSL